MMYGKEAMFNAEQFTSTATSTAADKAKFANQFVRFALADFCQAEFPKWFYSRLSMTFGHIAHYNQSGFYAEFFTNTRDKLTFLEQSAKPWTGFAGDPKYTYCDVERVLAEWVIDEGLLEKYAQRLQNETEVAERAELARLQAKYPEESQ